jgi:bacterioferritin
MKTETSEGFSLQLDEAAHAERIAVESCRQMIDLIGPHDPTTRRLLEPILADEEEHADEMKDLLEQ